MLDKTIKTSFFIFFAMCVMSSGCNKSEPEPQVISPLAEAGGTYAGTSTDNSKNIENATATVVMGKDTRDKFYFNSITVQGKDYQITFNASEAKPYNDNGDTRLQAQRSTQYTAADGSIKTNTFNYTGTITGNGKNINITARYVTSGTTEAQFSFGGTKK